MNSNKDKRYLFYHVESDCFIETFDEKTIKKCFDNDCSDVTDIAEFENMFKQQEGE